MDLDSPVSRRRLLVGALATGAAGAAARIPVARAAGTQAAPSTGQVSTSGESQTSSSFFADPTINFQLLFTLGAAGYGAAETGEVLATFDRIHARGDTYRVGVPRSSSRSGASCAPRGDERAMRRAASRAPARPICARRCISTSRSSSCWRRRSRRAATRERTYSEMEAAWAARGGAVPAALSRCGFRSGAHTSRAGCSPPVGGHARPTMILNNGSDAQNIDMYVSAAPPRSNAAGTR